MLHPCKAIQSLTIKQVGSVQFSLKISTYHQCFQSTLSLPAQTKMESQLKEEDKDRV